MKLQEQIALIAANAPGMTVETAESGTTVLVLRFTSGDKMLVDVIRASWVASRGDSS